MKAAQEERARIGLFLWWFEIGGTERHALRLLERIDRTRFEVEIICFKAQGQLAEAFAATGWPIHTLRGTNRYSSLLFPLRLWRLLRALHLDVLHSLIAHTLLIGPITGRFAGVRSIVTSERNRFDWKLGWPSKVLARWVNRHLVDAIIVNSREIGNELALREDLPEGLIHTIHNGVSRDGLPSSMADLRSWRSRCRVALCSELDLPSASVPLCGMVASLSSLKDHVTGLRACALLQRRIPDLQVVLAGDGPERENLQKLAITLGISERLHWLGRRTDVSEIMASIDLLLLSSKTEGFPNVALEALVVGTPVVSSRLPYLADLGEFRNTIGEFPIGDFESGAECMLGVLMDPSLREHVLEWAPRFVQENFSLEVECEKHERLYQGLLTQRS